VKGKRRVGAGNTVERWEEAGLIGLRYLGRWLRCRHALGGSASGRGEEMSVLEARRTDFGETVKKRAQGVRKEDICCSMGE
jgi:hypothetical protein